MESNNMENIELIQTLTGNISEKEFDSFDCYVRPKFGIFIPIVPHIEKSKEMKHKHPAYEIIIYFDNDAELLKHYRAEIISPNVVHERSQGKVSRLMR